MRHRVLALLFVLLSAPLAHAFTLEQPRIEATLFDGSGKDPFRIRARLGHIDPAVLLGEPITLRFGKLSAHIPAGGFRRRGGAFTWRSGLFGVKKVTINVNKATLDIVGGGTELGALPGPVTLAFEMPSDLMCGRITWSSEKVRGKRRRRSVRREANAIASCATIDAADRTAPLVTITGPTGFDGISIAAPTVTVAGLALDDAGLTALSWSNDRGGGGSLAPTPEWTIDVGLQPGDNLITVSAADPSGNVGADTLAVTYNTNGIVFDGMPVADPDGAFVNATGRATVRQAIVPNPDLDPESVRLMRVSDVGGTLSPVGTMVDDGNLAAGDEIQGDAVYTGKGLLRSATPALLRFRVAARTLSQPDVEALSPVLTFPVVDRVSPEQLAALIALANDARALLARAQGDGLSPLEAIGQVIGLALVRGAQAAGPSEGGLGAWWIDANGLLGGVFAYDQSTVRGGSTARPAAPGAALPPRPRAESGHLQVGSRRALVLAPYFASAEPAEIDAMLRASTCPLFEVESYAGADAGAERFQDMDRYGMIVIASHGESFFGDVDEAYRAEWGWGSLGAQIVIATGTVLSEENLERWERDLRLGRMAVLPDGVVAILPGFVSRHNVRFPESVIYAGSCRSAANITMASSFFGRGAASYFGYDGYVDTAFAQARGVELFTNLLGGATTGAAFTATPGGTPTSALVLDGRSDAVVTEGIVLNPSFEAVSGFAGTVPGFTVLGDGRVVGGLGMTVPTDGVRMALISTGLGLTTEAGSFSQPVCLPPLPPGATSMTLSYDWNFFSEEFLEYCNSQYQDSFVVDFAGNTLQSTIVDDLCGIVTPSDVGFDKGGVYATGWLTQNVDVTALAGTSGILSFSAHDVGDSIFDSAILVDRVRVEVQ